MASRASIAVCVGHFSESIASDSIATLFNIVEEATGEPAGLKEPGPLAGPNDTVQMLLDAKGWAQVAVNLVEGMLGSLLASGLQAGLKAGWRGVTGPHARPEPTAFRRLILVADDLRQKDGHLILGFPRGVLPTRWRNVGVEITNEDPDEVARVIAMLAQKGPELELALDDLEKAFKLEPPVLIEENGDCSTRLFLTDAGDFELRTQPRPQRAEPSIYRLTGAKKP